MLFYLFFQKQVFYLIYNLFFSEKTNRIYYATYGIICLLFCFFQKKLFFF